MAKRRMFSLDIVDTDKFLEMPATTQLLYFQLGMHADDDGFVSSPKKIMKTISSSADDLRLLCVKNFIIPFDSGVVVIKDWKVSNEIKKDRYRPTIFQDEFSALSLNGGSYELSPNCLQIGDILEAQVRIGEDSIGKDRTGEDKVDYQEIVNLYNDTCVSFPKALTLSESRKKAIKKALKTYSLEDFKKLFEMAESSRFLKGCNDRNWSANFDWLIKDSSMAKVLEGNYEDRRAAEPSLSREVPEKQEGDRFACLDVQIRQELEAKGVIEGQTLVLGEATPEEIKYLQDCKVL